MHKTAAWPLTLLYAALILFASWFPFEGWRAQGVSPWVFLFERVPPPYWTWFDVVSNLLGYAPLGFLLALACLRSGHGRYPVLLATLGAALLSLLAEFGQIYLPQRVPSNLDWLLNSAGAAMGALLATLLEHLGVLAHWSRFRQQWFVPHARGALVLLALWPWALLFPAALPLGLGQVVQRLEGALSALLQDTPFLAWMPLPHAPLQPLAPAGEMLAVALGMLLPCLLVYCVVHGVVRRALLALSAAAIGFFCVTLSTVLSYGPAHALQWLSPASRAGLLLGVIAALAMVGLRRRLCTALLLVVLLWHLALLNQAPTSAYFAQTLQAWEQGRFIRFYGLGQWLGWLWPYGVLVYTVLRLSQREAQS